MKTGIYIRVSTQEQADEGFSIAAQKQRLMSFCQSQDWDIGDIYIDDGWSAKDLERPALKRMLIDIEKKEIDVVLVYRLDRLTRSVLDLYQLLEKFDRYDVAFKSATEVYDTTTAIGRLFITLVAALAQWERENLAERVRFGMEQMTLEGKWHGGEAPYGYIYEDKKIKVHPQESETVNYIINSLYSGAGVAKTCQKLNRQFDKYPTRSGKPWSRNTVRNIAKNIAYLGKLRFRDIVVDDVFPVFVDVEKFAHVNKMFEARRELHPRQIASDFIFSGLLRCNRCGQGLNGMKITRQTKTMGERTYYTFKCSGKAVGVCDLPHISEALVVEEFLKYIDGIQDEDTAFKVAQKTAGKPNVEKEIRDIEKELHQIKERRKRYQIAFANEAMTLEELKELTESDRNLEKELKERLKNINKNEEDAKLSSGEIAYVLRDFRANWDFLSRREKKNAVQMLVKRIVVDTPLKRMPTRHGRIITFVDIEFR